MCRTFLGQSCSRPRCYRIILACSEGIVDLLGYKTIFGNHWAVSWKQVGRPEMYPGPGWPLWRQL
eukprot:3222990-Pyramimonas_sp.AAC.1